MKVARANTFEPRSLSQQTQHIINYQALTCLHALLSSHKKGIRKEVRTHERASVRGANVEAP